MRPDDTGKKFGHLTAIKFIGSTVKGRAKWLYKCDCGAKVEKVATTVRQGAKRNKLNACGKSSCSISRSHGFYKTPTHNSWRKMRERCSNTPSAKAQHNWKHYGGKGIKVCDRWQKFVNFLADMGERPEGHTIDRINSDGDYEPGNCRWATMEVQNRHAYRSKNRDKTE